MLHMYVCTSVADGLLEQVLQEAAVEGAVLGQQNVLQEVVALLELVPEEQVALRLLRGWFRGRIGKGRGRGEGGLEGWGICRRRQQLLLRKFGGRGAHEATEEREAWPAGSGSCTKV